jgi:hypothetical protein
MAISVLSYLHADLTAQRPSEEAWVKKRNKKCKKQDYVNDDDNNNNNNNNSGE